MRPYLNLEVKELINGIYADKETALEIKTKVKEILREKERLIREEYFGDSDRVISFFVRQINSPDEIEKVYNDILSDIRFKKLLGYKIIRRNNKEILVHKDYFVFMVREEKTYVLDRASSIR